MSTARSFLGQQCREIIRLPGKVQYLRNVSVARFADDCSKQGAKVDKQDGGGRFVVVGHRSMLGPGQGGGKTMSESTGRCF